MSEKKGLPTWAKLTLAGIGVVGGIFAIYELATTVFAAGPAAASNQLTSWSDDYAKELAAIVDSGTLPTSAQEYALKAKQQQIDDAYNRLFTVYGIAEDVLLAAVGAALVGYIITATAKNYWNTHVSSANSPASYIMLFRNCQAIDAASEGEVSYAVALNTQTQTVFSQIISPYMQTEVSSLEASTATLVGTELELTETLITTLDVEIETTIPELLEECTEFLGEF